MAVGTNSVSIRHYYIFLFDFVKVREYIKNMKHHQIVHRSLTGIK